MKNLNESKEALPIDFLTQFVSKGWEEVGTLKASIEGIKKEFTKTKEVEEIIQELIDSYLIAIGQVELYMGKKDYIDTPDPEDLDPKKSLKEAWDYDSEDAERLLGCFGILEEVCKALEDQFGYSSFNISEQQSDLSCIATGKNPDGKDFKLSLDIEGKFIVDGQYLFNLRDEYYDSDDEVFIDAALAAVEQIANGDFETEEDVELVESEDEEDFEEDEEEFEEDELEAESFQRQKKLDFKEEENRTTINESFEYFTDFGDPEPDAETDSSIRAWRSQH